MRGDYWNYWFECMRFGRAFLDARLDDAATLCRNLQRAEGVFRSDATSGVNALQSYMVRRESGQLEAIRPMITGSESPAAHWAPGLLALYTELRMPEPAQTTLDWLLEHDDPIVRASADWPARLTFMT
ncbi:hypothetical protein ACC691_36580, partial [Rhizobium johnstonii]|uniref:hypothetical protein n=1 Tax=Rhizobium johnstonii TaxID=3019933 RepID=UPI003F9A1F0A